MAEEAIWSSVHWLPLILCFLTINVVAATEVKGTGGLVDEIPLTAWLVLSLRLLSEFSNLLNWLLLVHAVVLIFLRLLLKINRRLSGHEVLMLMLKYGKIAKEVLEAAKTTTSICKFCVSFVIKLTSKDVDDSIKTVIPDPMSWILEALLFGMLTSGILMDALIICLMYLIDYVTPMITDEDNSESVMEAGLPQRCGT